MTDGTMSPFAVPSLFAADTEGVVADALVVTDVEVTTDKDVAMVAVGMVALVAGLTSEIGRWSVGDDPYLAPSTNSFSRVFSSLDGILLLFVSIPKSLKQTKRE